MIKKIAVLLYVAVLSFTVKAQLGVGTWRMYSSFSGVTDLIETPGKVYYTSNNLLFSYDKDNEETYTYSVSNRLNDNDVSRTYYNPEGKYLVITYSNANIDLLYDNGKVVNLPDIKDVPMSTVKTVNDVAFNDGKIYVATNFGLVVYDDSKHEVINSGNYSRNVSVVDIVDGHILIVVDYDYYWLPENERINSLSNYKKLGRTVVKDAQNLGNGLFLMVCGPNLIRVYKTDIAKNSLSVFKAVEDKGFSNVYPAGDGSYYVYTGSKVYSVSTDGEVTVMSLPSSLQNNKVGLWSGSNSMWAGSADGLGHYSVDGDNVTVLGDRYVPEAMTVRKVGRLFTSPSGKIYAASYGNSHNLPAFKDKTEEYYVNIIHDGVIKDVTPVEFEVDHKATRPAKFKDGYDLVEDPNDSEAYYLGSMEEGVYRIKDRKQTHKYYSDNSSLHEVVGDGRLRALSLDFDRLGNLWVGCHHISSEPYVLNMLSANGLKKDETTPSDWKNINIGIEGERDIKVFACKKSNMIFIFSGAYESPIVAYDTKGTASVSDDTFRLWEKFTDQDGKSYEYIYVYSIAEDENGRVWIGTSDGVIEITRPSEAINADMRINRIKVPRNDGTNYADYLLSSQNVYAIATDNSNRKWLATETSGVYLVNENGSEILEHYNIDNSILPSNTVYAVTCDVNSNSVFFGTEYGLIEYSSTSAPASDDYSEVYAYPNPVRPDYTGWITVKGLMDNSLVKIADAAGNVFFQGMSEGGMVIWDGCNSSGQRVKTGVYYVFASRNESGQTSGAVTKILVVN